jgi:hypothetical protein
LPALTTCQAIVEPYLYSNPPFHRNETVFRFIDHLRKHDSRPIGLNRIPYSSPGRWIQILDFSEIRCDTARQLLDMDMGLTALFPLTPFLTSLFLGESINLSSRALMTLAESECITRLQQLAGLQPPLPFVFYRESQQLVEDPLIQLLSNSTALEKLGLRGPNNIDEVSQLVHLEGTPTPPGLSMPHLQYLSIRGLYAAGVVITLSEAHMPSLRSLSITRSDFLPADCTFLPRLLDARCVKVHSLHFYPPSVSYSSQMASISDRSLTQCPNLRHLTLSGICSISRPHTIHPLTSLTIPKPTPALLGEIEGLLPLLPQLRLIKFSEVRWLPTKMNAHARASGVPGEMSKWKRRLGTRRIVILDADGKSEQ